MRTFKVIPTGNDICIHTIHSYSDCVDVYGSIGKKPFSLRCTTEMTIPMEFTSPSQLSVEAFQEAIKYFNDYCILAQLGYKAICGLAEWKGEI
jgi:hypothetical protein